VVRVRYASSAATGSLCLSGSVVFGKSRVAEYALGSAGPADVAKHLRQLLRHSDDLLDTRRLETLMNIWLELRGLRLLLGNNFRCALLGIDDLKYQDRWTLCQARADNRGKVINNTVILSEVQRPPTSMIVILADTRQRQRIQ